MARNFHLWTPIANAFDAYRRRYIVAPKAVYEHLWRLIHIEEALIVTVGSAAASNALAAFQNDPERNAQVNNLRRKITGQRINSDDDFLKQNCFTGSIDAWINVLNLFKDPSSYGGAAYCDAVSQYLNSEIDHPLAFIDVWTRIAPVPSTYRKESLPVLERVRAINVFRNKLAHVPISHRLLEHAFTGLRTEVIRLLSSNPDDLTKSAQPDFFLGKIHGILSGAIATEIGQVHGPANISCSTLPIEGKRKCEFIWKPSPEKDSISWNAMPFVRLDSELKAMLLFRVNELEQEQEQYDAEYHRFAAEMEPVHPCTVDFEELVSWIPVLSEPTGSETEDETNTEEPNQVEDASKEKVTQDADSLIADGDFVAAASMIQSLLKGESPPSNDKLMEWLKAGMDDRAPQICKLLVPSVSGLNEMPQLRSWTDIAFRERWMDVSSKLFECLGGSNLDDVSDDELRDWAEIASKERHSKLAMHVFDELAKRKPTVKYNNVCELKHGMATWQHATRDAEPSEREALLKKSIQLLGSASNHYEPSYSARAMYQQSKAYRHLWDITHSRDDHKKSLDFANKAAVMDYDDSYLSWLDRLEREDREIDEKESAESVNAESVG